MGAIAQGYDRRPRMDQVCGDSKESAAEGSKAVGQGDGVNPQKTQRKRGGESILALSTGTTIPLLSAIRFQKQVQSRPISVLSLPIRTCKSHVKPTSLKNQI